MTDEISLAVQAVALVGPYLSALLTGAASATGNKIIDAIWNKVKNRLSNTASGQEALQDLKTAPTNKINLDLLQATLAKELAKDSNLAQEITELLREARVSDESMNQSAVIIGTGVVNQIQTKK